MEHSTSYVRTKNLHLGLRKDREKKLGSKLKSRRGFFASASASRLLTHASFYSSFAYLLHHTALARTQVYKLTRQIWALFIPAVQISNFIFRSYRLYIQARAGPFVLVMGPGCPGML
jgi:hypothetical protein